MVKVFLCGREGGSTMEIYNPVDSIVRAYLAGLQVRLLKQREQMLGQQMLLDALGYQETVRKNMEDQAIRREEIKRKAEEDERQKQQAIARTKADYGKLLATGQLQFPRRSLTPAEISEVVSLGAPVPDTREPYNIPGFDVPIQPSEVYQNPFEYQRQMAVAKSAGPLQVQTTLEDQRQQNRLELENLKFEHAKTLLQERFSKQLDKSAQAQARFDRSFDHRQKESVARVIGSTVRSQLLKDYFGAARAMYYLQTNAPDEQFASFSKQFTMTDPVNGVRDLSLIYNYIRSLDESVVREGEINNLNRTIPIIGRLGIGIERYIQRGIAPLLTQEQRQKIANEIRKNYMAKKAAAKNHLIATYNTIKYLNPSVDFETFKALVLPYVSEYAAFHEVGLDDIEADNNVQKRNRQPVMLIPKIGGANAGER